MLDKRFIEEDIDDNKISKPEEKTKETSSLDSIYRNQEILNTLVDFIQENKLSKNSKFQGLDKKLIDKLKIVNNEEYEYDITYKQKISNIYPIMNNYLPNKINNLWAVLVAEYKGTKSNYGFVFFENDGRPKLICCGSTYNSKDGEYRNKINTWEDFYSSYIHYNDLYDVIDKRIYDKINNKSRMRKYNEKEDVFGDVWSMSIGKKESKERSFKSSSNINTYSDVNQKEDNTNNPNKYNNSEYIDSNLSLTYILSEDSQRATNAKKYMENFRIPILAYEFCWLYDYYNIINGFEENHMNIQYKYILYDKYNVEENEKDLEALNKIRSILSRNFNISSYTVFQDNIYNFMFLPVDVYSNSDIFRYSIYSLNWKYGYKFIPTTYGELLNIENILYPIWAEIMFAKIAHKIVLSGICPSFPLYKDWFIVNSNNGIIFDGESIREKYRDSTIGENIIDELQHAIIHTYKDKDPMHGFLNSKFKRSYKLIEIARKYQIDHVAITKLSVGITSDFIGRTLRDSSQFILSNERSHSMIRENMSDPDTFAHIVFNYIYGASALARQKVIHADMHINNITLYYWHRYRHYVNRKTMYIISPENIYLFKYFGLYGGIIDFSRSLYGDFYKIREENDDEFVEKFKNIQISRIKEIVELHFPNIYAKFGNNFIDIFKTNFETAFKVLTAIDIIIPCRSIYIFMQTDKNYKKIISAESLELLKQIVNYAEDNFVLDIVNLINREYVNVDQFNYLSDRTIEKCFKKYKLDSDKLLNCPDEELKDIVSNPKSKYLKKYATENFPYTTINQIYNINSELIDEKFQNKKDIENDLTQNKFYVEIVEKFANSFKK